MALWIANLDQEAVFAGSVLPERVRRAISAAATLIAALAEDGDALWTPEPVDPARVPDIPGVPRLELVSGERPRDSGARWWCRPDDVTRRVNHRAFGFLLARRLGVAHAEARLLSTIAELEDHLARTQPAAWVLKAPMSAAGRERLRRKGSVLDDDARTRARRLLERADVCLFEPWLDRTADFGVTDHGVHRLDVDASGVFRGIDVDPALRQPLLRETYARVAGALAAEGYDGPFGIDAYQWRDPTGAQHLQPLSEINARYTFGHVARALAARVPAALGIDTPTVRLRLATAARTPPDPRAHIIPLLHPTPRDPTHAWLELPGGRC